MVDRSLDLCDHVTTWLSIRELVDDRDNEPPLLHLDIDAFTDSEYGFFRILPSESEVGEESASPAARVEDVRHRQVFELDHGSLV